MGVYLFLCPSPITKKCIGQSWISCRLSLMSEIDWNGGAEHGQSAMDETDVQ